MKDYIKNKTQPMEPWVDGYDMDMVSISQADLDNGSPKTGDMIAVSSDNENDKWLVAEDFFKANYIEVK